MNFYAYLFVFSVFHKTRQKCKRLLQWTRCHPPGGNGVYSQPLNKKTYSNIWRLGKLWRLSKRK